MRAPLFAILGLLGLNLMVFAHGLHEQQWQTRRLNVQNAFNELVLYIFALTMFFCQGNLAVLPV